MWKYIITLVMIQIKALTHKGVIERIYFDMVHSVE